MAKSIISLLLGTSSKKRKQQSKARSRDIEKIIAASNAAQKKLDESRKMTEMITKGYVLVTVKSLNKYIKGAIISIDLLNEIGKATDSGCSKMFVHKDVLADMDKRLLEYKEFSKKLSQTAFLNNKGREYEKQGKISLAIKTYEKNIEIGYPAHQSFKRLMILYRKNNDYENERRVILRAIEVFPDWLEYKDRLNKVEQLINK